ncbi:MAG: HAD hydrolase-like protein [Phycisphaerae bacterium]|nr:HAD hydrolase-like protein [Phycisphaerae bacterium]
MPEYKTILFDLDGTLTDPAKEMTASARYALEQFGVNDPEPEKMKLVTEIPLLHWFEEYFGMTQPQANQAFQHFWYYAGTFGVQKNRPYDGIRELLEELTARGALLCIATARKTANAHQILKATKMDHFFPHVMGSSNNDMRRSKKLVIFDLMCELPEDAGENAVMIGDRVVDITGAQANGMDSIGVTYGQEPAKDVINANPTYLVNNVSEMAAILLNN